MCGGGGGGGGGGGVWSRRSEGGGGDAGGAEAPEAARAAAKEHKRTQSEVSVRKIFYIQKLCNVACCYSLTTVWSQFTHTESDREIFEYGGSKLG